MVAVKSPPVHLNVALGRGDADCKGKKMQLHSVEKSKLNLVEILPDVTLLMHFSLRSIRSMPFLAESFLFHSDHSRITDWCV